MKYKTTRKEVKNNYNNLICVSYCNLQTMLTYKAPIAYATRAEGWAFDVYELPGNNAIITGYAPFGNIKTNYDICQKYEKKARQIINRNYKKWQSRERALNKLIEQFTKEMIEGEK